MMSYEVGPDRITKVLQRSLGVLQSAAETT